MSRHFTSRDYNSAGLATMARQASLGGILAMPYKSGNFKAIIIQYLLKTAAHELNLSIAIVERATSCAVVLAEQASFPLFLDVFNEFYSSIEPQIAIEKRQLRLLQSFSVIYTIFDPLGAIALYVYCSAIQAHIDAHETLIYAPWESKVAKVTSVYDGDSIRVDATPKAIRVLPIDCPEMNTPEGVVARDYARSRLLNETVLLKAERKCDKYLRILARVFIGGVDYGEEMMRLGYCPKYVIGQLFKVFKPGEREVASGAIVSFFVKGVPHLECVTDELGCCTIQNAGLKRGETYIASANHPDYGESGIVGFECCNSLIPVKLILKE